MAEDTKFAVILVYSISHAIRIETLLKKSGIEAKLIPTPRYLSSDCGSAVRIPSGSNTRCLELITENNIEYHDIVDLVR